VNLLVDTHVLLWWLADDPRLPGAARAAIAAPEHRVSVSAASAWEIAIKRALGKLDAPDDLRTTIIACGFEEVPVTIDHASIAGALPRHHDDPFDRMLVAQAQVEELTIITLDARFASYDVERLPLVS
jgi:PIN domain nuclease of toxin-antitoxin system